MHAVHTFLTPLPINFTPLSFSFSFLWVFLLIFYFFVSSLLFWLYLSASLLSNHFAFFHKEPDSLNARLHLLFSPLISLSLFSTSSSYFIRTFSLHRVYHFFFFIFIFNSFTETDGYVSRSLNWFSLSLNLSPLRTFSVFFSPDISEEINKTHRRMPLHACSYSLFLYVSFFSVLLRTSSFTNPRR